MLKVFVLITGIGLFITSCDSLEKNDAEKKAMTAKMQEKVKKISVELKVYCDSEIYRKARWKADSIISERRLK